MRVSKQLKSIGYRLANLETVVGEPAQDYAGWSTYTGLRGSISSLSRRLDALETPPPKPTIEKRITFTGSDRGVINHRIIQWLADPGVDPDALRADGEHCALAFTADNHAELRQAVLTYAQEHRL